MHPSRVVSASRRSFLRFLATSPALAVAPFLVQSTGKYAGRGDGPIPSPDDAIDIFDFEVVARKTLDPAHWGYLATGTDDDATIRANREGFERFQLRPRRLVDVRHVDTSTEVLGKKWPSPIVIAPTGSNKAFHPEGEIAVARASSGIEEVNEARGEPVWFQLYAGYSWDVTRALVARAEKAGSPALVLTVDLLGGSNRETVKRFAMLDRRDCASCHPQSFADFIRSKPMYAGIDVKSDTDYARGLTWDFVRRLKDSTSMKLLIKGIVTREDTELAIENGVDGVIVSNHGGRAEASGRGTIESLPEVVDAAGGRIAVLVDGGFRRGTDIFKALALGADAVAIGRPYLWGLASFGQLGVEAVLQILRAELELSMRQMGTTTIDAIQGTSIVKRGS
jgi:4-hydroxymandelate oxidase